jgi:hypothetical protein
VHLADRAPYRKAARLPASKKAFHPKRFWAAFAVPAEAGLAELQRAFFSLPDSGERHFSD